MPSFAHFEIPTPGWFGHTDWQYVEEHDMYKAESAHSSVMLVKIVDGSHTKFVLDIAYSDGTQVKLKGPTFDALCSAWFTPQPLANKLASWALAGCPHEVRHELRVLEPSAGEGAIARALIAAGVLESHLTLIELDPNRAARLLMQFPRATIWQGDMFELLLRYPKETWDLVVGNPPYDNGLDTIHMGALIRRVPNVVALLPLPFIASRERYETVWTQAFLHRMAVCVQRPKHIVTGGESGMTGKRDSVVFDISTEPHDGRTLIEWWSDNQDD